MLRGRASGWGPEPENWSRDANRRRPKKKKKKKSAEPKPVLGLRQPWATTNCNHCRLLTRVVLLCRETPGSSSLLLYVAGCCR